MASKPRSVEIRGYQVGFGDCFLLSFEYGAKDKRHILIDFGTMKLPPKLNVKAEVHMRRVAESIRKVCDGKGLTAVIATHRHQDHISGFGTDKATGKSGEIIRQLRPKVVLQPWTEDPDARKDARNATRTSNISRKSFVASLQAMQDLAQLVTDLTMKPPDWMGPTLQKELSFIGLDNIKNESAVRNLIAMGQAKGAKAVWAHHGSTSGLERLLPGVKIHVLGPPDLRQSEGIRKMASSNKDEFWQLLARPPLRGARASSKTRGPRSRARSSSQVPIEARWFRDRLKRLRGQQLLQIVRILDDQMNNTSLILLFEVLGKKLLFPGDAQLENWSYALKEATNAKQTKHLLADTYVYKVGHHGSRNATPRNLLWEGFQKRKQPKGKRLQSLLSTLPGKHGKARNKTEVPRRTLLEALDKETDLANTNKLRLGKDPELCFQVVIGGS